MSSFHNFCGIITLDSAWSYYLLYKGHFVDGTTFPFFNVLPPWISLKMQWNIMREIFLCMADIRIFKSWALFYYSFKLLLIRSNLNFCLMVLFHYLSSGNFILSLRFTTFITLTFSVFFRLGFMGLYQLILLFGNLKPIVVSLLFIHRSP